MGGEKKNTSLGQGTYRRRCARRTPTKKKGRGGKKKTVEGFGAANLGLIGGGLRGETRI